MPEVRNMGSTTIVRSEPPLSAREEAVRPRREEVREQLRAGLAVKAKDVPDEAFEALLPLIAAASDPRNLVKKAVNWALRAIGKRNPRLRRAAIGTAENIRAIDSPAARWIASDALRELRGLK